MVDYREKGLIGSEPDAPEPVGVAGDGGKLEKYTIERTFYEEAPLTEYLTEEAKEEVRKGGSVTEKPKVDEQLTTEAVKETDAERIAREFSDIERKKASSETMEKQTSAFPPPEEIAKRYSDIQRKKAREETIEVTTSIPGEPFPLSKTIDRNGEETFKGERLITPEEALASKVEVLSEADRIKALSVWGLVDEEKRKQYLEGAKAVTKALGKDIAYKEQVALREIERKEEERREAVRKIYELGSSTETVSPEQYQASIKSFDQTLEETSKTPKEVVVSVTAPAVFGVARAGQRMLETVYEPKKAVEGVSYMIQHPVETTKSVFTQFLYDPIGTTAELGTELYVTGKVGKAVKRVVTPKVTEIPVKARGVEIIETKRKTAEGKVVKETQIAVDTIEGKPKERYFWEARKTKVEESPRVELERLSRQKIEGSVRTESEGIATGELKLKGDGTKAKLEIKDYTETTKPTTVLDLETAQKGVFKATPEGEFTLLEPVAKPTAKLPSGVPIEGTTPKLKTTPKVETIKKTRAGYEYYTKDKGMVILSKGEMIQIIKKGKKVEVPAKDIYKGEVTKADLFRSKPTEGKLLSETQYRGKFVKRKYEKKPKVYKKEEVIRKERPEFEVTLGEGGQIKKVVDLKEFQVTESGKVVRIGRKPISPTQERLLTKLTPEQKTITELITEKPPKSKLKGRTKEPVIRVIEKGTKVRETPFLLGKTKTKVETKQEALTKSLFDIGAKEETKILDEGKTKTEPVIKTKIGEELDTGRKTIFDTETKTDTGQRTEPTTRITEKTVTEDKTITQPRTSRGGKKIEEPIPTETPFLTTFKTNELKAEKEKKEKGYNTYMYEEGKKVKANQVPLPRSEAERLGRDVADNSLSASYKVSRTKYNVPSARRSAMAMGGHVNDDKFSKSTSKKRRGFMVEKRANRLDSIGERAGIKASKLIAQRKKSLSGGVFGGGGSGRGLFGKSSKNKWRL